MHRLLRIPTLALLLAGCADPAADAAPADRPEALDSATLLSDIRTLAADSMQGRRAGTEGNARARRFLREAFRRDGIEPVDGDHQAPFTFSGRDGEEVRGVNLVGRVEGSGATGRFVVITAHYDHLGVRNGQIFNGADDNASGTAGLLAVARHLREHPPRNPVLLVATDAEEMGLQGARAFVRDPPVPLEAIVLNLNLDMISRNDDDELYVAGTYHHPSLLPLVEEVARTAPLVLRTGHDRPDLPPGDDWTMASDHGAFHEAGIPFLYLGVEDHEDYHAPTDVFENIQPGFYVRAVRTAIALLETVDRELERIAEETGRVPAPAAAVDG